jgi:copper chaperone
MPATEAAPPEAAVEHLTLQIEGMSCGHCVARVSKALTAVPGVAVDDVQIGQASVRFDPALASADAIARAVGDAGYPARPGSA